MRSAYDREAQLQRVFPLTSVEAQAGLRMQISSFGVIPKHGQAGKWRLIVILSSPAELSDNAGVPRFLLNLVHLGG